jgi:hypothetical protein
VLKRGLSPDSRVVAGKEHLSTELDGEAVILHMGSGVYYGLNEVATRVLEMAAHPRSIWEIAALLAVEYGADRARCEQDLLVLMGQMLSDGIMKPAPPAGGDA